jgi:GxxExxY protein
MQHQDLTHTIIGCAMNVHSKLGSGFPEVIYQRALAIEMQKQMLTFRQELDMPVYYENIKIGSRRVDFFVEDAIMLELKATAVLDNHHLAQAINYLEAFDLHVGLLINFGSLSLDFKRVYNTKHINNKIRKND